MYTDIFIVRRDCVFQNFRIFPFLEKAIFSLFSSRKDAHFFFSSLRKDMEIWNFRIMEMSENPQKYHLFVYFRVFSPCKKIGFCAVLHAFRFFRCDQKQQLVQKNLKNLRGKCHQNFKTI